jgi:hypothetical protein
MLQIKTVGPGAAARKYDLITSLGAHALSLGKTEQRMVLRLITLVTARYNWARDELSVGQREIAQLWSCNERTVKREMAKLRGLGWLVVKRQGARGRVTQYSLGSTTILQATEPTWKAVGPDFVIRMEDKPVQNTVVPLPVKGSVSAPDVSSGTEWALAQAILYQEDEASFASWVKALTRHDRAGGRLTLCAPTRFHAAYVQSHLTNRILAACRAVDGEVSDIVIIDR